MIPNCTPINTIESIFMMNTAERGSSGQDDAACENKNDREINHSSRWLLTKKGLCLFPQHVFPLAWGHKADHAEKAGKKVILQ